MTETKLLESIYLDLYEQRGALTEEGVEPAALPEVDDFFDGDLTLYDALAERWPADAVTPCPTPLDLCKGFTQGPAFNERVQWYADGMLLDLTAAKKSLPAGVAVVNAEIKAADPSATLYKSSSEAVKAMWSVTARWEDKGGKYTIDTDQRKEINGLVALCRMFLDQRRLELLDWAKREGVARPEPLGVKQFFKGRSDVKKFWDFLDKWPDGLEDKPRFEDLLCDYHFGPSFSERIDSWETVLGMNQTGVAAHFAPPLVNINEDSPASPAAEPGDSTMPDYSAAARPWDDASSSWGEPLNDNAAFKEAIETVITGAELLLKSLRALKEVIDGR